MRVVDEFEQRAEDVVLNRKAATHFRREVFEKYANLHLDLLKNKR